MKKSLLAFATLLSLAVMPGAVHAATVTDRGATPLACPDSGAAVDESGFVSIGGIRQWVTIEGQDCRNPVVLMVHGGPGNPNTPFAHTVYADWTKDFTLVQWDQRKISPWCNGISVAAARPGAPIRRLVSSR
ncbi:alpha/beta fold hydrolase [Pseudoxanthomonas indica]|uniref:alpha/beta fold hydrolase n=1 Tax=Pseudoxanthomonas indica TaxID=428993 RepID=UPI0019BD68AE|nr:hypothetical protein [Pseudoxanthomonas indica]GGD39180.1 hypothetical protein GCM10007235_09050 [Pseudoxanthomonas indica]